LNYFRPRASRTVAGLLVEGCGVQFNASLAPFDFQVEINPSLLVFTVGGDRARGLDR
jgi:hypothetical protein